MEVPIEFESTTQPTTSTSTILVATNSINDTESIVMDLLPSSASQPESETNEHIIIDTAVTDPTSIQVKDSAEIATISNTIEIPPALMLDYGETLTFTGEYMESDDGQIIATFQNERGEKTQIIVQRSNVPIENSTAELLIAANDNVHQLETINTLNVAIDPTFTELPSNSHSEAIVVIDQNQFPIDNVPKQDVVPTTSVVVPEVKSIVEEVSKSTTVKENIETKIENESILTPTKATTESILIGDKIENVEGEKIPESSSKATIIVNNDKDLKSIDNNKISAHTLALSPSPTKTATILKSEPQINKKATISVNKSKKLTNESLLRHTTFNQTNQLSKSLKTYSRSNIVWLNIPENKEQTKTTEETKLTTTIEISSDNPDDNGSSKMWYPRTIKTKELPTLPSTAKLNQIQTSSKIGGEIVNKNIINNKISDKVKITMNNDGKGIISVNFTNKAAIKSGSIDFQQNANKDSVTNDDNQEPMKTQTRSMRPHNDLRSTNQKQKQQQDQSSSTPLQQPKKRVSYRNLPSPVNNLSKDVDVPPIDDTQKSIQDNKSTKSIPTTPRAPITEVPKNVVNFKRKDRRSSQDYCDYQIGEKHLKISIRMQPECRDEPLSNALACDICDYKTQIVAAFQSHKNWCANFRSHPKHSILSPSKTVQNSTSTIKNNNEESIKPSASSSSQNGGSGRLLRKRKAPEIDDINEKNKLEEKIENNDHNGIDPIDENDHTSMNHDQSDDVKNVNNGETEQEEENVEEEEEEDEEDEEDEEVKKLDGFSIKDIVWVEVKRRSGLWPALIIDISMNDRKLVLRAIDYSGKNTSFKMTTKSVVSHDRSVVNKFLKNHPNESRTVQKVEQYLRKRALEDEINPMEFFFESNTMINSMAKPNETSQTSSGINKNTSISIDGTLIYQFIKDGSVDSFLRSIHQGKVQNSRHKKFFEKQQHEQIETNVTGEEGQHHFGPIKDEDQQYELFIHLSKLYEDCLNKNKQDKSDEMIGRYIYSVWIPEAIIKAISKKYQVDLKKAGQLFDEECFASMQNSYRNSIVD